MFPDQCFLAHLEQVQAVRFSPNSVDVLTTVSSDRLCRLWNTANVDVPINEMRRGLMTDAQCLFYWNGIIVAQVRERERERGRERKREREGERGGERE